MAHTGSDSRLPGSSGSGTWLIAALAVAGTLMLLIGALATAGVFSGPGSVATGDTYSGDPGGRAPLGDQIIEPSLQLSGQRFDAARYAGVPSQVSIPDLGIRVPVIPIQASGGVLVPPANPRELGWWSDGAKVGAKRGSAVITGHTVHTGGGALDSLKSLQVGDTVFVRTPKGNLEYDVRQVRDLDKDQFARHATEIFDASVRGRLVLITCSEWDGRAYLANTVVYADPVAAS